MLRYGPRVRYAVCRVKKDSTCLYFRNEGYIHTPFRTLPQGGGGPRCQLRCVNANAEIQIEGALGYLDHLLNPATRKTVQRVCCLDGAVISGSIAARSS